MKQEITELQALQNAVNHFRLYGLSVHQKVYEDKRRTAKMYFLHNDKTGETISPVLDYENLNHFILGYGKALKPTPAASPVPEAKEDKEEGFELICKEYNGIYTIRKTTFDLNGLDVAEMTTNQPLEKQKEIGELLASAPAMKAKLEKLKAIFELAPDMYVRELSIINQ